MIFPVAEDKKRKRAQPELRIVEEFGDSTEVTRLGEASPDSPPSRKKASLRRSQENVALVRSLQEADDSPASNQPIEEDVGEPLAPAPAKPFQIPPIVFVLFGCAFLLLLGLGIFLAMGGSNRDRMNRMQEQVLTSLAESEQKKEEAREVVDILTEAIERYTSAETVEEKLAFSRQPERVEPLMRKYYQENELTPLYGARLVSQYAIPLKDRSFVVLTTSFEDGPNKIYLAEVENDLSVRIDWESDVCYQPVNIRDYIAERPTAPVTLRVFAVPDNFYVFEFADSEKYQCLKLTFRDNPEILYGYVDRYSSTSRRMARHFEAVAQRTGIKPEPLLLTVRFLEGGRAEQGVFIEEFLAPRWANIDEFADED